MSNDKHQALDGPFTEALEILWEFCDGIWELRREKYHSELYNILNACTMETCL